MYPAAFDYRVPATMAETLALLAEHGDDAKLMAGGQSLVPLLKLRFAMPAVVVDISRLSELAALRTEPGALRIGARTRHVDIERDPALRGLCPILSLAAPQIADPLVRNRGTVVGSVCHADPSGDWGSVMLALNAEVVARSKSGERKIPVAEFFQGPFTTALRSDEIATEIRIPIPTGAAGGAYNKLERKVGDLDRKSVV